MVTGRVWVSSVLLISLFGLCVLGKKSFFLLLDFASRESRAVLLRLLIDNSRYHDEAIFCFFFGASVEFTFANESDLRHSLTTIDQLSARLPFETIDNRSVVAKHEKNEERRRKTWKLLYNFAESCAEWLFYCPNEERCDTISHPPPFRLPIKKKHDTTFFINFRRNIKTFVNYPQHFSLVQHKTFLLNGFVVVNFSRHKNTRRKRNSFSIPNFFARTYTHISLFKNYSSNKNVNRFETFIKTNKS